jgi:lactoylglutathione lyase
MTGGDRARPFAVLGIQQVAIGARDKARLRTLWVDMLGLEPTGNFRSERENVDEDICSMGSGATRVEVDLMQPIDPEGKPAVHATPLNHIGLWIDDLAAAVAWLTARGVRFGPGGLRHLLPASEGQRRVSGRRRRGVDRARPGTARGRCGAASGSGRLNRENSRHSTDSLFER